MPKVVRPFAMLAVVGSLTPASLALVRPVSSPSPASIPSTGIAELDAALHSVSADKFSPTAARAALLGALHRSPLCFDEFLTREQWQYVLETYDFYPPTVLDRGRFTIDTTNAWQGVSAQGPAGRAQRAVLTYSFPNDGVTWGLSAISATGPNTLNAALTAQYGASDLDEGREYIRQALAAWRLYGGLSYTEVADGNIAQNQVLTSPGNGGGDIRIGGRPLGAVGTLAYNAFPSPAFAGVGGSDMLLNTSYFIPANFADPAVSFRYLRRTVAHEHGHGIGLIHQWPCERRKLMEPSIAGNTFNSYDAVPVDDRRAAGRNYGDRFSGNQSAATAVDFGNLTTPAVRSVIERDLSTNGAGGFGSTNQDWFRFTIDSAQNVTLTAAPTGGTYSTQQQGSGACPASGGPSVNAAQAGLLRIELYDSTGTTLIGGATAAAAGSNAVATFNSRPAGTYLARVIDQGPNAGANQTVQLYDLTVRVGAALARPAAVAGINKRIAVNTNCFFFGDITSLATEAGATISAYAWDLDGDGTFETSGGKVNRQYPSNGTYPVTLRVTDSNGVEDTDTITLTVFGGTTTLQQVAPANGTQGQTIPVTLTGNNLKNLTSAAQVTVSGSGVTVSGTPAPNPLGTSVTGLSFVIAGNAAVGGRNVTVTTADGGSTLNVAFAIAAGVCPGDVDGDGQVTFTDLNTILSNFGATVPANTLGDLDGDGQVTFTDLNTVLSNFGNVC